MRLLQFSRALAAIALLTGTALPAQQATLALRGQRVRLVLQAGEPAVGRLLESGTDSFRISDGSRGVRTVPPSEVRRIELSVGRRSAAGRGAAVGALVGGALGLLAVTSSEYDGYYTGGEKVAGFIGVTAMGAGVGALIGALSHSERWQEVELVRTEPVSMLVEPATRRVSLRVPLGRGGRP